MDGGSTAGGNASGGLTEERVLEIMRAERSHTAGGPGGALNTQTPAWSIPRVQMPAEVVVTRDMAQAIIDSLERMKAALGMAEQTAEGAMLAFRQERLRAAELEQRLKDALFTGRVRN